MQARTVKTIATGVGFTEGPLIRQDGEIVFVSIDQGRLYRIRAQKPEVLAELGGGPQGATEWLDGTIYVAQNGGRYGSVTRSPSGVTGGVQAVDRNGEARWLTKDPIAPNDLCFGPDGFLYVTDPTRNAQRNDGRLFRCDIKSGEAELLCSGPWFPNGIGFGLDDALYVARSGESTIVRYDIHNGRLGKPETFITMPFGRSDGFLFDAVGNLTTTAISLTDAPGQLQTYDRNGKLVDTFVPGPNKFYTNVALGPDRTLVITDAEGGAVLAVPDWPQPGLQLYPFRGSAEEG